MLLCPLILSRPIEVADKPATTLEAFSLHSIPLRVARAASGQTSDCPYLSSRYKKRASGSESARCVWHLVVNAHGISCAVFLEMAGGPWKEHMDSIYFVGVSKFADCLV